MLHDARGGGVDDGDGGGGGGKVAKAATAATAHAAAAALAARTKSLAFVDFGEVLGGGPPRGALQITQTWYPPTPQAPQAFPRRMLFPVITGQELVCSGTGVIIHKCRP